MALLWRRRAWALWHILLVGGAAMVLLLASCGDDGGSANSPGAVTTGIFVGKVSDSNAFVAVVAGSQAAVAAVVDGTQGIAEPFGGSRSSDSFALDSKHGAHLAIHISSRGANGSVTLSGTEHAIGLEPATGKAGLYRAAGLVANQPVWVLWVVLNDGEQRSAAATVNGIVAGTVLDTTTQSFTINGVTTPVADVEPDQPTGMIEDPGQIFAGGTGFQGGVGQFGGFNTFNACGNFNFGGGGGNFNFGGCQFSGNFGNFGGKFNFGGGGFTPDVVSATDTGNAHAR